MTTRRTFLRRIATLSMISFAGLLSHPVRMVLGLGRRRKRQGEDHASKRGTSSPVQKETMFYKKLDNDVVQCETCFRECIVNPGERGFCRVRENREGTYSSLVYGAPSAIQIDPIEKEPQLHMLPGTKILCFGTVGCNFKCRHCHNWHLSQASPGEADTYRMPPERVVEFALEEHIPTISFTYNEPTVLYEYVYETAVLARKKNLKILWHSNGAMNAEPLERLLEYTDAATVDLKGFTEKAYDNSSAELEPVLRTLQAIKGSGKWLEIVNLLVPTVNDDPFDVRRMCKWIKKEIGTDTPLHFSRFFPNYKLTHLSPTPVQELERARKIAMEVGLQFVTIGNVPGHTHNSTFCPSCGEMLIHRIHFQVLENNVVDGRCSFCRHAIPGIWK
jgi:pyruvate formate lyase activating enzyme